MQFGMMCCSWSCSQPLTLVDMVLIIVVCCVLWSFRLRPIRTLHENTDRVFIPLELLLLTRCPHLFLKARLTTGCKCSYCKAPLGAGRVVQCGACGTPHHSECFRGNKGCSVFGCLYSGVIPNAVESPCEVKIIRARSVLPVRVV